MFRTLIYPSSGACDCVVELPHRSSYSQFVVCWRFGVAGFEWCPCCRLKHKAQSVHFVKEATTYTTHKKHKRRISMLSVKFEPAISTIGLMKKYALDSRAIYIGLESLSGPYVSP